MSLRPKENHGVFPFNLGQIFFLTVMATENLFKISVNGEFFCDFPNIQEDLAEINFCEVRLICFSRAVGLLITV